MQRKSRFEILTLIVIAVTGLGTTVGVWWSRRASEADSPPRTTVPRDLTESSTMEKGQHDRQVIPQQNDRVDNNPVDKVSEATIQDAVKGTQPTSAPELDSEGVDLSPTSWENPFQQDLWQSAGWLFESESMQSARKSDSSASFRRPYRKVMIDTFVWFADNGQLEFQLFAPDNDTLTIVSFSKNKVIVEVEEAGRRRRIESKEISLTIEAPNHLRLRATGNRLNVFCNDQRVLSCNQPAQQSGREFHPGIVARNGQFRLFDLRIEGE